MKEPSVKEEETVNKWENTIPFNEAKRIKIQLKLAIQSSLRWDDPNIPHRSKVVDGDVLCEKVKTIIEGIST